MSEHRRRTFCPVILILGCLLAPPRLAADEMAEASSAKQEKDWSVDFTPYVWVVNINGEIAGGPIDQSFGVGIIDLLEHLKGMAMADLTVRYKRVGLIGDGMWARVESSDTHPGPASTTTYSALNLSMAFGTGAAFYEFRPTANLTLDPYIGARWWRLDTTVSLVNSGPLPPSQGNELIVWADPIFGLRVNYDINEKWRVRAVGDVGGGVSKVSWQALIGGAYQFNSWFALDVVYRVMGVDYEPDGKKIEMKLNGLVIGFNFHY